MHQTPSRVLNNFLWLWLFFTIGDFDSSKNGQNRLHFENLKKMMFMTCLDHFGFPRLPMNSFNQEMLCRQQAITYWLCGHSGLWLLLTQVSEANRAHNSQIYSTALNPQMLNLSVLLEKRCKLTPIRSKQNRKALCSKQNIICCIHFHFALSMKIRAQVMRQRKSMTQKRLMNTDTSTDTMSHKKSARILIAHSKGS